MKKRCISQRFFCCCGESWGLHIPGAAAGVLAKKEKTCFTAFSFLFFANSFIAVRKNSNQHKA
jgi:hypothetical protein